MTDKNIERLKLYERKFAELNMHEIGLMEGEKIVHCTDALSFNGKFFVPEWAITNMGRCYSVWGNKWLTPQATGTRRYWHFVGSSKQPAVHELVENYFRDEADQIALEEFGEEGICVQHKVPIEIPEDLKYGTAENRDARINHCMEYNKKANLCFQKQRHNLSKDRLITNGCPTVEEKEGTEVWSEDMKSARTMFANSGKLAGNSNGAYVVYSRDNKGNLQESINMILKLKGSLFDEDTVFVDTYKINGGATNKEFIEKNIDKVLEVIKMYPPKSKNFEYGRIIDGKYIYYALD